MNTRSDLRERTAYDEDFLLWSEEQAKLLRRRAAAWPEAFAGLDIENLAEEIGDLGKSQLRAAESLLIRYFAHLIELASDPTAPSRGQWRREVVLFRHDFRKAWVPSMRQLLDVEESWGTAREAAVRDQEGFGRAVPAVVPERCPFTVDDLLAKEFDLDEAIRRLGG